MLDSGEVTSFDQLAEQHDVDRSYVGRILKLATLSPDIIQTILADAEPNGFSLARLRVRLPLGWNAQRVLLGFSS